jgi:GNAT superfamily N-acetyltransferase
VHPIIRSYRPADLAAVYDICVRTADGGADARGMYIDDRLMGDIFAAPYVTLEPEHAHLLDDGTGTAVGYILGTSDTERFARRYHDEWLPATADRYPAPADPPVTPSDMMLGLHLHPERMVVPELAAYPAHLMQAFLAGVHAAGAPKVHLGMVPTNTSARAFYERLGFTEIPLSDPNVFYMGRDTAQ